jgi:hypothetical protein
MTRVESQSKKMEAVMITFTKKTGLILLLFTLSTSSVFAERGGFGGYHGGGGNDAVIYRGNNDAVIHRDNDNEFQNGVIVTPGVSCTTEQVCDSYGQCSLQQNCD